MIVNDENTSWNVVDFLLRLPSAHLEASRFPGIICLRSGQRNKCCSPSIHLKCSSSLIFDKLRGGVVVRSGTRNTVTSTDDYARCICILRTNVGSGVEEMFLFEREVQTFLVILLNF